MCLLENYEIHFGTQTGKKKKRTTPHGGEKKKREKSFGNISYINVSAIFYMLLNKGAKIKHVLAIYKTKARQKSSH